MHRRASAETAARPRLTLEMRRLLSCTVLLSCALWLLASGCSQNLYQATEPSDALVNHFWSGVRPVEDTGRLLQNASRLKAMGRVQLAVKELELANQRDPANLKVVDALAQCYEEMGQWHRAEELYRQGLERHPGNASLANNLCFSYYQAGNLAKAEACLRHTLQRYPDNAGARNNLGLLLTRQGREQEALALWLETKGEPEARELLNQALACLGKAAVQYARLQTAGSKTASQSADPAKAVRKAPAPGGSATGFQPENVTANRPAAATSAPVAQVAPASGAPSGKPIIALPEPVPEPAPETGAPESTLAKPSPSVPADVEPGKMAARREERNSRPIPEEGKGAAAPSLSLRRLPVLSTRELVDTKIEILNGNGVPGLARRQRSLLELEGFTVAAIGNHVDFGREQTEILFRPGSERVAEVLRGRYVGAGGLRADAGLPDNLEVRVILGRDLLQKGDILAKLAD